jgi:hypothetical protein
LLCQFVSCWLSVLCVGWHARRSGNETQLCCSATSLLHPLTAMCSWGSYTALHSARQTACCTRALHHRWAGCCLCAALCCLLAHCLLRAAAAAAPSHCWDPLAHFTALLPAGCHILLLGCHVPGVRGLLAAVTDFMIRMVAGLGIWYRRSVCYQNSTYRQNSYSG